VEDILDMGKSRMHTKCLVSKWLRKIPLGKYKSWTEDNIKIHLNEVGYAHVTGLNWLIAG
jgi:hypothetical protein